jgi:hypothetical protein
MRTLVVHETVWPLEGQRVSVSQFDGECITPGIYRFGGLGKTEVLSARLFLAIADQTTVA